MSSNSSQRETVKVGGLEVRPVSALTPDFVGLADGLDLSLWISDALRDDINAAMDRFAVLIVPQQVLDDEQLFGLGQRFGPIETAASQTFQQRRRIANPQINDISNLGENGEILATSDRYRLSSLGNRLWHSDSSFKAEPARYSMLHARVTPPEGGHTEFADMRAAWDALPDPLKQSARDLICEHSIVYSRKKIGFTDFSADELARCAPVPQRLVRRHERTGRHSLFLSSNIGRIQGWPIPEALLYIQDLSEFATQREFVYRHNWQVHDLVIWDNAATMHRGLAFDSQRYPRDLRRVTLRGQASTLATSAWD
jgi:alpha-ketoglutarate-dependent 2,4-dichlorophenoxyacetate dioxygenase